MHKFIALIPRREDCSREYFKTHYETSHAPLAIEYIEHFRFKKYVRNHILYPLVGTDPGVDVIAEFWYARLSDLKVVEAFLSSSTSQVIHDDENRFMIPSQVVSSQVHEHLIGGPARGFDAGSVAKMAMGLRREPEVSVEAFVATVRLAAVALAVQPGALRVTLDEVVGAGGVPWDVFVHVWLAGMATDIAVPTALLQNAAGHFLVATESCESLVS